MGGIRRTLLFDAAVPPEVNADDFGRHCEVEANAAGFEGGDHDFAGVVILEIHEGLFTFRMAHLTVELLCLVSGILLWSVKRSRSRYLHEAPFFLGEQLGEDVHPEHVNETPFQSLILIMMKLTRYGID